MGKRRSFYEFPLFSKNFYSTRPDFAQVEVTSTRFCPSVVDRNVTYIHPPYCPSYSVFEKRLPLSGPDSAIQYFSLEGYATEARESSTIVLAYLGSREGIR